MSLSTQTAQAAINTATGFGCTVTQTAGVGATLTALTAAGTYGANEQTMLQDAYNKILSIETALKTVGIIAT